MFSIDIDDIVAPRELVSHGLGLGELPEVHLCATNEAIGPSKTFEDPK